jgi:hypothetical protein
VFKPFGWRLGDSSPASETTHSQPLCGTRLTNLRRLFPAEQSRTEQSSQAPSTAFAIIGSARFAGDAQQLGIARL